MACSFTAKGQANLLDKMVQLPKGKITLKVALTLLEKQSTCIFSYDPTKIEDKQILTITVSSSQTLAATLKQILPLQIKYKQTGKYIVLQKNTKGQASLLETYLKPLSLHEQEKIVATAIKTQHKADMSTPADYLTPRQIETKADTLPKSSLSTFNNKVDTFNTNNFKNYAYPSANLYFEQQPTKPISANKTLDSLEIKPKLTSPARKTDTLAAVSINKINGVESKNKLINILSKKGVLDLEIAANNRLTNLSLHTGLYGIYAILSYTKVNNNNTRTGLGLGTHFKMWKNIGMGVELVGNRINNSVAEKIGINSSITQLSIELNYKLTNHFYIFIRPNIYRFKSIYSSKATEIVKVEDVEDSVNKTKTEDPTKIEDFSKTISQFNGVSTVIGMRISIN